MSNIDKLKSAAAKAVDNFDPNMFVETRDVLALLDELEAMHKYAKDRDAENEGLMITVGRLRVEKEAAEKRIAEQMEIMRQAASDISYAIFNLTGSDLSRLQPGVVETTDPTDTALIAERNLRAAAAGKGE